MPTDLERKQNPKDTKTTLTMLLLIAIVLLSFIIMHNRDSPKITNIGIGNIAIIGDSNSPRININSASIESLESLPSIGPVLAKRIVEGRPYTDVMALNRVKGIGPATIESIKDKVTTK